MNSARPIPPNLPTEDQVLHIQFGILRSKRQLFSDLHKKAQSCSFILITGAVSLTPRADVKSNERFISALKRDLFAHQFRQLQNDNQIPHFLTRSDMAHRERDVRALFRQVQQGQTRWEQFTINHTL